LKNTSIYTLYFPCSTCAKEIVGSGIEKVFYVKNYLEEDSLTKELFTEAGVKLEQLDITSLNVFFRGLYITINKTI